MLDDRIIDEMTAINHTSPINGKASAVCHCCSRKSRLVAVDSSNEPDLWHMSKGWSQSPFPADYVHRYDGSIGSMYTCPRCNQRLKNGEALQTRGAK